MKTKSFFLGFLIGGATAGITVLLNTPSSGKETTKYLRKNLNYLKESISAINNSLLDLIGTVQTASKESVEEISTFIADVKKLVTGWQQDIKPHQIEIKRQLDEIKKNLTQLEKKVQKDNINRGQ